jgi:hypothetical protein
MRPKNAGADQKLRPSKLRAEPPLFYDMTPHSEITVLDEKTGEDELLKALIEHHG